MWIPFSGEKCKELATIDLGSVDLSSSSPIQGKLQKTELGKSASEKVVTAKDSHLTLKGKTQKANAEQVKAGKKVENKDNVNDQEDEDEGDDSDDEV
ncbi:hypothetical protein AXF42_Ash002653 [Apostasia shenzhenica]|uniref:Uncharacterized protein n=1 Tax=Apostasia shenzhenica TaxID=1088818 RepID=A0A2I0A6W6_9ASPA|nr:hypothetical protein AXF42_Ash002653 [Apostasia shenzhenica]